MYKGNINETLTERVPWLLLGCFLCWPIVFETCLGVWWLVNWPIKTQIFFVLTNSIWDMCWHVVASELTNNNSDRRCLLYRWPLHILITGHLPITIFRGSFCLDQQWKWKQYCLINKSMKLWFNNILFWLKVHMNIYITI